MLYEELLDLLPDYALGTLDTAEQQAVEIGLAQYPELRKELQRYQATVDQLAFLVPVVTAPPDLGDRLMKRLERESAKPQLLTPRFNPKQLGLIAAAVLMVIFAIILWQLTRGDVPEDEITAILENAGSTEVKIEAGEGYEVSGVFVIAPDQQQAVLQVENLAVLPPEQTYQLWMSRGEDDRISAMLFRPEESDATLLVTLPPDFETFRVIGVTVEPAGGSEGPTSPAVFFARLPE